MPRPKTGCSVILYTSVTPEAMKSLAQQVELSGVSRPQYVDAMIKAQGQRGAIQLRKPAYKPHKRVVRKSPGAL